MLGKKNEVENLNKRNSNSRKQDFKMAIFLTRYSATSSILIFPKLFCISRPSPPFTKFPEHARTHVFVNFAGQGDVMAAPDTNTLIFPYCIVIVTSLLLLPGLVLLISFCLVTFLLVPHYLASLQTGLATFFLSGWGGTGRKRQGKG